MIRGEIIVVVTLTLAAIRSLPTNHTGSAPDHPGEATVHTDAFPDVFWGFAGM
jgi:hypothetical protein